MVSRPEHLRPVLAPMALALLALALTATASQAGDESLCLDAARSAAEESGVPYAVLLAIAQTETGRQIGGAVQPWPWTVNESGQGYWFSTRAEAEEHAAAALAAGRSLFDLGCFQINYRWHGGAFASAAAMLDPGANARYAAAFLAGLHDELGDWSLAAGAYHSRTEEFASRYRTRFDAYLAAAGGEAAAPPVALRVAPNSFPLLIPREGARAPGSLVPIGNRG